MMITRINLCLLLRLCSLFAIAFAEESLIESISAMLARADAAVEREKVQQGVSLYAKAVELIDNADEKDILESEMFFLLKFNVFSNMGTSLLALDRLEEGAQAYSRAIGFFQKDSDQILSQEKKEEIAFYVSKVCFTLGQILRMLGQFEAAIEAFAYVPELDPGNWGSFATIGEMFDSVYNNPKYALEAYTQAYTILTDPKGKITDPPEDPVQVMSDLLYCMGRCLSQSSDGEDCGMRQIDGETVPGNCIEMAEQAFAMSLDLKPDNAPAKHLLASLKGDTSMKRAENVYVEQLFDGFAEHFEEQIVGQLSYNGYERLRRGFDKAMESIGRKGEDEMMELVIDAGCGTGLVGEQFRNTSQTLIGVDLSAAMLEQAQIKRPQLFDETRVGDFMTVFAEFSGRISAIVAGDSFLFLGDLAPVLKATHDALKPDGFVAFTLEAAGTPAEEGGWKLNRNGRFSHERSYVERTVVELGFSILHYEFMESFRLESGEGVDGHVFVLQKQTLKDFDEL